MGREYEKGVEPSSSLIHRFGDEIGREGRLELLLVFERVMNLSVGHAVMSSRHQQLAQDIETRGLTFRTRTNNRRLLQLDEALHFLSATGW